jgi:NAD(P)-dependent dehydrogenase (short-subunit alcohol dehydrogenase family)
MLQDRVVLITGAGRGLGREHALACAEQGAKVVVNDLGVSAAGTGSDRSPAQEVVAEIEGRGGSAIASSEDIADFEGARRLVAATVEAFGDLHVVVNNAGFLRDRMIVSMTEEDFDAVVSVHLKGTFNTTHHAATYWRQQSKSGREVDRSLINTTSGAGLHGNVGQSNYAAAKAGIAAMTLVSAKELKRYSVRANAVAPFARTRMVDVTPALLERVQEHPLADPAKVAPLVVCLAAADCDFTGQVFSVYGGSVGIYQGWSVHEEVETEGTWDPHALAKAMDALPRRVKVNNQLAMLLRRLESTP